MANRAPFEYGEWYHCFNRGVEKRNVFENEYDAARFLLLLRLANGTDPVRLHALRRIDPSQVIETQCGDRIVSVGAYCLMPNHFHILVKEVTEGGITTFMKKVSLAYTMYFNSKYERVGNLFLRPFRSRHVGTDRYFQKVLEYIHLNPAELYERGWKAGKVGNIRALERRISSYPYSSLKGYLAGHDADPILSRDGFEIAAQRSLSQSLAASREYLAEISEDGLER